MTSLDWVVLAIGFASITGWMYSIERRMSTIECKDSK